MAIEQYNMLSKEEIVDQFEGLHPPNFSKEDVPHSDLAALFLSINDPSPEFIEANYMALGSYASIFQ